MKILIIIDDLFTGGTEKVLAMRLTECAPDMDVHIVTLYAMGPIAEQLKGLEIKVDFLNLKEIGILEGLRKMHEIASNQFDIAICMRDISKALFPRLLKKHIPVVVMLWDSPVIRRSFKQSCLEWYQVKFSGAIPYSSSKNIANTLIKTYNIKDVKVIPNCFDDHKFKLNSHNTRQSDLFKIITLGSMRIEKNHQAKIDIAKTLKKRGAKFNLTIIGRDTIDGLQEIVSKNNLSDEITLLGDREDIPEQLKAADLFLFTSSSEGFPVALMEAMATGLPCVSYEFPSLKELDNDYKFIDVIPQDSIDSAADRIIYWSENKDEAIKLGRNASNHVHTHFSVKENTRQWKTYLESLA